MAIDYERDMKIDVDSLDVEWWDQSSLALKYGKHYADLWEQVKFAEEEVKIIRSELILKANENPSKCCHKDKPNLNDIEAYYRTDKKYREAKDKLIGLQKELMYAEHAKDQICWTRRAALENLVKLHGQQWFAGPKVPRDLINEITKFSGSSKGVREIDSKIQKKVKIGERQGKRRE